MRSVLVLITVLSFAIPAWAADGADPKPSAAQAATAAGQGQVAPEEDRDLDIDPLQPDFTLVNLPTTLRMPRFKSAFRVTHRFTRPLGQGDFDDLLQDAFGIDSGAAIGLEYRFGIMRGTYVGVRRTNDRTIEFLTEYNLLTQLDSKPVGLSAFASIDGTNNFRDSYSPGLGVVVSRTLGRAGTVYANPMWVNNTNPLPSELIDDNNTFMVGLGARFRIRPSVYLVGEFIPRVAGFEPDVNQGSFGIEKLLGGHVFQLNFSNGLGTLTSQLARGGSRNDDWFLGFNISRKFY